VGEVGVWEFPGGDAVGVVAEDLNLESRPARSRENYDDPEYRGVRKREKDERGRGSSIHKSGLLAHG